MQSPTHIESSSTFPSQEHEPFHFRRAMRSSDSFSIFSFSREGSSYLGQSSKRLSADRLRCGHRRFYMVTSVGIVSHILADPGWRGELLTKQRVFSCNPMRDFRESRYKTSQVYIRLSQSRLQASKKRTYVRDTRPFSNGTPPS